MITYITEHDDLLDAVCYQHYGVSDGATEAVLENNPVLALHPMHLPAGLSINLPDLDLPSESVGQVQLWD